MIDITDKSNCVGCSACYSSCPQKCITLINDEYGFAYPIVDSDMCLQCGICNKVCPIENGGYNDDTIKTTYVAYANDNKKVKKCSSGAISNLLCEGFVIENNIVYGAAFDNKLNVRHKRADSIIGVNEFNGSKYVQSRLYDSYINVKKDIFAGKKVLFTGLPCQIAGLKSFLGKEYENLYTVDLLCHGVPSEKLFDTYKQYLEKKYKSKITSISFKDKTNGWLNSGIKVSFDNSNEYYCDLKTDPYLKLFLQDICLRPSCYKCKFKKLNRVSDLTLGDAWGIKNIKNCFFNEEGNSLIIIHSEKGNELFNSIKDKCVYKETECNIVLKPNAKSRRPAIKHDKYDEFGVLLQKNSDMKKMLSLLEPTFINKLLNKILCK